MQKHFEVLRRSETSLREVVVMVDDDRDLRATVVLILEDAGFEVLECEDLAAGFALLRNVVPDVLLVDRELPDGSGLDLATWMRERDAYDDVRIVGFSGRDSSADVKASLDSGCDAFVAKPCRPEILVRAIRLAVSPPRAGVLAAKPPAFAGEPPRWSQR